MCVCVFVGQKLTVVFLDCATLISETFSLNLELTGSVRPAASVFQESFYLHLPSAHVFKVRGHILYPKSGPTTHPKRQTKSGKQARFIG